MKKTRTGLVCACEEKKWAHPKYLAAFPPALGTVSANRGEAEIAVDAPVWFGWSQGLRTNPGSSSSVLCYFLRQGLLLLTFLAPLVVGTGCAGSVSGANSSPTTSTLTISNVQVASTTASASQIVWTTDAPADSQVQYGTTISYGSSTPVDPTMVTSH